MRFTVSMYPHESVIVPVGGRVFLQMRGRNGEIIERGEEANFYGSSTQTDIIVYLMNRANSPIPGTSFDVEMWALTIDLVEYAARYSTSSAMDLWNPCLVVVEGSTEVGVIELLSPDERKSLSTNLAYYRLVRAAFKAYGRDDASV